MSADTRLDALEAWRQDIDSWHLRAKLNKLGDAITELRAENDQLKAANRHLSSRVAALEALDPTMAVRR